MKKVIFVLCIAMALSTFTACGGSDGESSKTESAAETSAAESSEAEENTEETSAEEESEAEEEEASDKTDNADSVSTQYFSIVPAEGYSEDPDDGRDSDSGCSHQYCRYGNGEDEYATDYFKVSISSEKAMDYRLRLKRNGISLEDLANDAVETIDIGGIPFIEVKITNTHTAFYSRLEGLGFSVTVDLSGEDTENMTAMRDSIKWTMPEDKGNVDAPYPWDGEHLITETGTEHAGTYSFSAVQLVAEESFLADDCFDNRVVSANDKLYVLLDKDLRIYTIDGESLVLEKKIELDNEYSMMSADADGNVYLSASMDKMVIYKDGEFYAQTEIKNESAVAPDGSWCLSFFTTADSIVKSSINKDGTSAEETFALSNAEEVGTIFNISITENYVFVCGSDKDNKHRVFQYDYNGNFKRTLNDKDGDGLGSITGLVETPNGILGLDGNLRNVVVWNDASDNAIAEMSDTTIFGTYYPWTSGLCKLSDGTIVMSLVDERKDASWDELVIYRIDTDF